MRNRLGYYALLLLCVAGCVAGFFVSEGTLSVGTEYTNQGVGYGAMFGFAFLFVVVRRTLRPR